MYFGKEQILTQTLLIDHFFIRLEYFNCNLLRAIRASIVEVIVTTSTVISKGKRCYTVFYVSHDPEQMLCFFASTQILNPF